MTANAFSILIFGPTGRVGSATLRAIDESAGATNIRRVLFSRTPPTILAPFETHIAGSLDDRAALTRAMSGIDRILLITADSPRQLAWEKAVVDAAARSDARPFIVKISAITAAMTPPMSFGIMHKAAEDHLRQSGLAYCIIRPTMFLQSLEYFLDPVQKMGKIIAAAGSGAVSFVDLDDVGAAAATVLCEGPEQHAGRTYTVTGPQAHTFADVAAALSETLGRSIRHISPPPLLARPLLKIGARMDWWLAGQVAQLFAAIRQGGEAAVTDDIATLLGRPPGTLAAYLAANTDVWTGSKA